MVWNVQTYMISLCIELNSVICASFNTNSQWLCFTAFQFLQLATHSFFFHSFFLVRTYKVKHRKNINIAICLSFFLFFF